MTVSVLLAVDDRPDNLFVLEQVVGTYLPEIEMITAESAEAGLVLAAAAGIDGALIDVQMPGINGIEMCRRLKADPRTAPIHVILVTAHGATSELKAQGLEAGADDFIAKPIDNVELAAKLRVMLRLRAAEQALRREQDHLEKAVQERTQALGDAESRYRTLFQSAGDAIFINDLEGRLLEVNDEACRRLGYTREELLRLKITDMVTPEHAARRTQILEQLRAAGHLMFETEHLTRDGHRIPIECSSRIIDFQGRPAVFSIARDINERQAAAAALRRSEERNRTILRTAMDGFWRVDLQGRLLEVNEAYCRMSGYREEELLGMSISDLEVIETPADITAHMQKIILQGEERFETRHRRKNGSIFEVEISVQYKSLEKDQMFVFIRDITERQGAVAALRESEERFRVVFEKAPIGIMHYDQTSTVTECNAKFVEIIGAPKEKFIGFNMIRQLRDEQMRKAVIASLDGQVGFYEGNYSSVTAGKLTPVRAIYQPIFSPEGLISGGITIFEDITERQRAVSELKLKENLLDSASDSIFLHDLEGNFLYMNEAAYITRWYAKEELLSLGAWALATPEAAVYQDDIRRELWANGELIFESEHRRKDGSIIPVEIFARVLIVEGQEMILSIARDITERHRAEEALKESLARTTEVQDGTIEALAALSEARDPYTAGHQRRVTRLACAVARELGLPADRVAGLRVIGLLHDMGKISVPAEILSKPGKLSDTEFAIIKSHAQAGYEIVKEIRFPWPVAEVILQHHERLDGSGYPQGLQGDEIVLDAKILAVADVVEAMASHRPYRPAWGIELALEEIAQKKGVLYDPEVVDACLKLFAEKGFQFDEKL